MKSLSRLLCERKFGGRLNIIIIIIIIPPAQSLQAAEN